MFLSILAITLGTALVAFGINQKFQFVKMIGIDEGKMMIFTFKGKAVRVCGPGPAFYWANAPFIGDVQVPAMEMPSIPKELDPFIFQEMPLQDGTYVQVDISYSGKITDYMLFYRKVMGEGYSYTPGNPTNPYDIIKGEVENKARSATIQHVGDLTVDQALGRANHGRYLKQAADYIRIDLSKYTEEIMGFKIKSLNIESVDTTAAMKKQRQEMALEESRYEVESLRQRTALKEAETYSLTMKKVAQGAREQGINVESALERHSKERIVQETKGNVILVTGSSNSPVALGAAMQSVGEGTPSTGDAHDTPGETGDER